jgi:NitT/TauT family transport system substrate-binding protein
MLRGLWTFSLSLTLVFVLANTSLSGEAVDKLVVPYSSIGGSSAPIWVPGEARIFEKYGLTVDVVYIATSTTIMQATLAGGVDLSFSGQEAAMTANLGGGDTVVLASGTNRLPFSLYVKPIYTRVEDLRGRKIGVSRFGSSTDFTARHILAKHGLVPGQDVIILQTGGVTESFTALKSGLIDGGVFSPPSTIRAAKEGLRELVNMGDEDLEIYSACVTASRAWIRKNEDKLRRFMKAYVEGIARIKKDKEFTINIMRKYTRTGDREILSATYDYFVRILPRDPSPTVRAMTNGLQLIAMMKPAAATEKPERFMEPKFVKELRDGGFIDNLYK